MKPTFDNDVWSYFATYSALLLLKMLAMSLITSFQRMKNGKFANPEDTRLGGKVADDVEVERVRSAHRNDLEGIPAYLMLAMFWAMTGPSPSTAHALFATYTITRYMHSIVYVFELPHKLRSVAWSIGYLIALYMGVSTVWTVGSF